MRDETLKIIDEADDLDGASATILSGPKSLALYCIQLGLEHLTNRRRAVKRRELRAVVQPEFTQVKGITGRVVLTKQAQKRIVANARELFDGWMINAQISLGDATKEDLLMQAVAEENSATGHTNNARLYRALAEPLKEGQRAADYWTPKQVQKLRGKFRDEGQQPPL
jgi:hypothetical protein